MRHLTHLNLWSLVAFLFSTVVVISSFVINYKVTSACVVIILC